MLERRPAWRARLGRVSALLERRPAAFVLGFRFLYGLRVISPFAIGLTSFPARTFLVLNATGAALWAVLFGVAGYLFGAALEAAIGRAERYEAVAFGALALAGAAIWLIRRIYRRGLTYPLPDLTSPPLTSTPINT